MPYALYELDTSQLDGFFLVVASPLGTAAGDGQVIQQVSANGQRNLRPFTVKDRWEIQWDSKGSLLTITIYKADGKLFDAAAMQQGPGSGSSYQPKGGEYYLQISGTGEWTITVVQLP
jgi:hypothetical protein